MSELTTLAHELRTMAGDDGEWVAGPISASVLREAADTIESLRDRLQELQGVSGESNYTRLFGTPERAARNADPVEIQLALARFADEWTTTDTRAQEQRLITYYAQQIANLVDNPGGEAK